MFGVVYIAVSEHLSAIQVLMVSQGTSCVCYEEVVPPLIIEGTLI
jgi:hypothetical protein